MRVRYLPANAAWCCLLGDTIVPIDDRRLWTSRRDLVNALAARGLRVLPNGHVEG